MQVQRRMSFCECGQEKGVGIQPCLRAVRRGPCGTEQQQDCLGYKQCPWRQGKAPVAKLRPQTEEGTPDLPQNTHTHIAN